MEHCYNSLRVLRFSGLRKSRRGSEDAPACWWRERSGQFTEVCQVGTVDEKKVHLVAKASFQAWRPLSGVVFREESEFEVKNGPKPKKTSNFENF